jgi:hypothetical protein
MTATSSRDEVVYLDSDIPPGMTVDEWRRQRPAAARAASHGWRPRGTWVARVAVAKARRAVTWLAVARSWMLGHGEGCRPGTVG